MSAPTARLTNIGALWVLRGYRFDGPTFREGRVRYIENPAWTFEHRHLAVQFAARRGIRLVDV